MLCYTPHVCARASGVARVGDPFGIALGFKKPQVPCLSAEPWYTTLFPLLMRVTPISLDTPIKRVVVYPHMLDTEYDDIPTPLQNRKARQRRAQYKKRHNGQSPDLFEAEIMLQDNLCPIGHHRFDKRRGTWKDSPCQDHDHATGLNRGIICNGHNLAIGAFHDSVIELRDAITYLNCDGAAV